MSRQPIGFFGGSFDPIHFGHINLALQIFEIHRLQAVLFCPVFCSPHKTDAPPLAAPQHRLNMLKLALSEIPQFRLTTIEIDRGGISYTIDTIRQLHKEGLDLRLILSEEAAAHFDRWKEPQELIRLASPLIGARRGANTMQKTWPESLKKGFTPTRLLDISSTDIRDRIKQKLYCGHLVPAKALDYIHSHHLYSS